MSSTLGSSTYTGWKRRSSAASFSTCLRYSSRVVAPIMCSSPRASIGLSMLPASMLPSAAPAPTTVCSSSTNSRIRPSAAFTSASTACRRSSNSPRYFAPATSRPMSRAKTVRSRSPSGHVAVGDPLGQALDDRGLADAGVADEHRVVLGLAGQDLDHATDLGVAADHRVPLPGTSGRDQVLPVLGQRLVGALRGGRADALVAAHRGELAEERVAGDAVPGQHPTGRAALGFGDHGHQQVLDGDVLVGEPPGLLLGLVEERGQPRRDHDLALRGAAGAGRARHALQLGLDVGASAGPRRRPSRRAAAAPARRAGRAARAAGAARRPRRGRPGSRRPAPRQWPAGISGSAG